MGGRVASCELRVAGQSGSAPTRLAASRQPPAASPSRLRRPGISLLEVLISMFVLLFGLMGVAAVFPVGNHFAGKGEQYDRGAALAEQAFADIKARGMLDARAWIYPDRVTNGLNSPYTNVVIRPSSVTTSLMPSTFNAVLATGTNWPGPGHVFVIDPMGLAAAREAGCKDAGMFPFALFSDTDWDGTGGKLATDATNLQNPWTSAYPNGVMGTQWPVRRVTVAAATPFQPNMTSPVAETLCRLRDDLANDTPENGDHPGMQRWAMQVVGAPDKPDDTVVDDDIPLARSYGGSYSWLATIVPTAMASPVGGSGPPSGPSAMQPAHPEYYNSVYDVSAVVFHKRDTTPSATSERAITASLNIGGELVIHAADNANGVTAVDNAVKDIFPGQWIAVAGVHPTNGLFLLKWYKLQSLDDETVENEEIYPGSGPYALRRAMLEGPDWPAPVVAPLTTVQNLRAIILPGVISVVTHPMTMERE